MAALFLTRSPSATVLIAIENIDLKDGSLRFFLDGKPIAAADLEKPIEVTLGSHDFRVQRSDEVIRHFTFTVRRDGGPPSSCARPTRW